MRREKRRKPRPLTPHACKQPIWERAVNSGCDVAVIMREGEHIVAIPISTMMRYGWPEHPWRVAGR